MFKIDSYIYISTFKYYAPVPNPHILCHVATGLLLAGWTGHKALFGCLRHQGPWKLKQRTPKYSMIVAGSDLVNKQLYDIPCSYYYDDDDDHDDYYCYYYSITYYYNYHIMITIVTITISFSWVIKCPHWTSPNQNRYMVNAMATFLGDVQYSQNGTVTNPCRNLQTAWVKVTRSPATPLLRGLGILASDPRKVSDPGDHFVEGFSWVGVILWFIAVHHGYPLVMTDIAIENDYL